ncbi:uncharacterized protein [Nicotiana sylvestris]|uniref:uncharacterized protein n=1 Tax=Nicotiana sylvestris TaxID=4096 RepID=UPI00388C7A44
MSNSQNSPVHGDDGLGFHGKNNNVVALGAGVTPINPGESNVEPVDVSSHITLNADLGADPKGSICREVRSGGQGTQEWTLDHVPREKNSEVDALANLGSSVEEDDIIPGTVVQLSRCVVEEGHAEMNSTSLTWDWRNKYIEYLKNGKLTSDHKESRALRTKVVRFTLDEDGTLYRRTFDGPLALCLGPGDTDYVLREIRKGTCGNHSGAESLTRKIIRAGYYWDSMEKDTKEFFKKSDKCQRFAPMIHQPGEQLHSVLSP